MASWSDYYNPTPEPKGDTTGPLPWDTDDDLTKLLDPDLDLWHAKGQRSRDGGLTRLYGAKSGHWGDPWDVWAPRELSASIWSIKANTEPGPERDKLIAEAEAMLGGSEPSIRDFLNIPEIEPPDNKGDPDEIFHSKDEYIGGNRMQFTREYLDANPELWNQVQQPTNYADPGPNWWLDTGGLATGREPDKDDAPYRSAPKPGDPDYTPPPSFPGQDIPKFDIADSSEEIAQIASSEGLQPGSLQDNLARETKQQKLAQETGTAIRQLETDQRSSEPTLAERLGGRAGAKQMSEGRETTDLLTNILDWQGLDNKGATLREKITPIGDVLGMIPEGLNALENVAVGAIPLIKSFKHTAGWTQATDENPARIHHTPSASRTARDRANEYINSLSGTEIAKIREDGRLSDTQLSQLTTAIQPNQTGTEWNYTMNSLANPRIDLEDNPRQEGQVQVKRLHDNFQFDSEKDVSFDLPGKPIQKAVEFFQNQNIKNDPLRATYELDQSDPGNTRNTRRMPVFTEFDYTWDNIKHGLTPKGPNRGRSGANNKMKARGSTYNPTLNRNVLRIPN